MIEILIIIVVLLILYSYGNLDNFINFELNNSINNRDYIKIIKNINDHDSITNFAEDFQNPCNTFNTDNISFKTSLNSTLFTDNTSLTLNPRYQNKPDPTTELFKHVNPQWIASDLKYNCGNEIYKKDCTGFYNTIDRPLDPYTPVNKTIDKSETINRSKYNILNVIYKTEKWE